VTRVKICGITRLEDAELATSLGAWALGFNLWPQSKRVVEEAVAAGIARRVRRRVELVGIFVNPTLDEVARAVDAIGLTHVQLHGDEGPVFATEVARRTGAKIIKAARVAGASDLQSLERFRTDYHLLDTAVAGERGGSGQTWDWTLAAKRRSKVPMILAGGLTPDNVAEAIAQVGPYAVDVASGVEAEPGVKDHAKLEAFLAVASPARAGIS
jgi:phosphoribosylanthranilate isomerase